MKFPKIPYAWLALTPYVLFAMGFLSNAVVMGFNGGQMPVLWPGGCVAMKAANDALEALGGSDPIHSCMTKTAHLKFMADWIIIKGVGIASPGDFGEWAWQATYIPAAIAWVTLLIKDHNQEKV